MGNLLKILLALMIITATFGCIIKYSINNHDTATEHCRNYTDFRKLTIN